MAKITVRTVTRLQKFLAAIAGDGVAPNPITDKEKLLHNIAENVNNGGGSGGLPPVTAADAGKVLTAQASATKGAVIVPEQTVELSGKTPVELTGVTSFPSDGDVVIVVQRTLPGETDTAVTVSHGTIIINSQDEVYSENGKYYCKSSQASNRGHTLTLTVYASVQTVNTAWKPSALVVTDTDGTLDKTWQEIKDADFAVVKILGGNGYESGCVTSVGKFMAYYDVQAFEWGQDPQTLEPVARVKTYRASSADGYPTLVE